MFESGRSSKRAWACWCMQRRSHSYHRMDWQRWHDALAQSKVYETNWPGKINNRGNNRRICFITWAVRVAKCVTHYLSHVARHCFELLHFRHSIVRNLKSLLLLLWLPLLPLSASQRRRRRRRVCVSNEIRQFRANAVRATRITVNGSCLRMRSLVRVLARKFT